ncbi:RIP metalloprotease RseP [Reichenbachiella agarivorans]|uniref:Zinc metalloprotease n=1 Tax=Reichenbachiella agarivorans TaxID=2979464 RepID=A0ABY6CPX1_9BACT|nr:RIP metalloprotease RseP [Reichenbachiella agarivorans]UXP32568.1 RIP metalloprotease RseP [Reichenbachiella agarivorans]
MEGLIMAAQLMLGLSILVGLHEMGHLLAAKAFGMRVEKYSIGFPPKIWGFQYGETEYSFGAIPLGGFVKISGMIDESLDTEAMAAEPEPWEFRSKPAWQRLIVMMGGIIVNVITGIVIFITMTYSNGDSYVTKDALNQHGIVAYELADEVGFKTGDKILKVNGSDFERFTDLINNDVILNENSTYTVQRADSVFDITLPSGFLDRYADKKKYDGMFLGIRQPFAVGQVQLGSLAAEGGLQEGDKFVSINGQPITYFDELKSTLTANKDKEITAVVVDPQNTQRQLDLTVGEDGTLGFVADIQLDLAHEDFTFGESVNKGTEQAFNVVWVNIKAFGKIFRGEVSASKSLSGPIGIAQMFGGTWNWNKFWSLTGLLSMVLAFMNFLPIPALDGGHVVFLTYEMLSGQKPSDKFLEGAQKVGMVLLLGLMGFAIFNDLFKAIF